MPNESMGVQEINKIGRYKKNHQIKGVISKNIFLFTH